MKTRNSNRDIYGSFSLDGTEVVVEVQYIQEAVNFPEELTKIPLAPDFLKGLFRLRGMVIPVVSLKNILGFDENINFPDQKIAILEVNDVCIGFVFDKTGSIVRPKEDEKCNFGFTENSENKVIKGVLKLGDGEQLLQILDPEALVAIKNIPQVAKSAGDIDRKGLYNRSLRSTHKKCILFTVGKLKLAFEITEIHEIINVPVIQRSPFGSKICLGVIKLRENIVIVFDFAQLLKEDNSESSSVTKNEELARKKIIILNLDGEFVGLVVDAIESINSYSVENIMKIPILGNERVDMFNGCLTLPDTGNVILLNHKNILSQDELSEVTQGHSKIYKVDTKTKGKLSNSVNREPFIAFKLNYLFGISIKEVSEIINYSLDIIRAPGMPFFIEGILNLRGKLVTIINTKKLYALEGGKAPATSETKIIIFKNGLDLFGLIVDSVENIIQVDMQNRMKLPEFFINSVDEKFKEDVKEVIEIKDKENKPMDLLIISMNNIALRARAS